MHKETKDYMFALLIKISIPCVCHIPWSEIQIFSLLEFVLTFNAFQILETLYAMMATCTPI